MKIKLLKQLSIAAKHREKGEVVEVSDFDGNYLTCRGFAETVNDPEEKTEVKKPKAKAKK